MNHMALYPDKTKFVLITTRHSLTVKGNIIEEVQNHRVLGVIIDNNLS